MPVGTQSPTTAAPSTANSTASPTPSAPVVIDVTATLVQPFVSQYTDKNSVQFVTLEQRVVQMVRTFTKCLSFFLYFLIFFLSFHTFFFNCNLFFFLLIYTVIVVCREAMVKTRASENEAVVGVQFNDTAPPADIPQADAVAITLRNAVSNSNNTFNLTVDASSIQAAPISATTTANTTTTLTNTTTALTTTATTEAITSVNMFFKTKETFTSDLLDLSSPASISRTSLIDTIITPIYQSAFSSFRSLEVTGYSNGSIRNDLKLRFASTSVPNNTQIGHVLIKAAPNITAFIVDTNSVFVNDAQVSNGVSHKISVITASCLLLLSWLLTNQQ
ncbi:hypothetical protein Q5P01_002703 [Channa striata]|uniref:SEA domain-containing protein n=1 Tax=Channa striata TaxID=64152 RepID=A0AA88NPP1_CHASR|nr:hypothetical protein Q5P01_002703 [Channa striata]